MNAAVSWASNTSEDSDPVERRMREVLTRRDYIAFAPVHEIALAKSKRLRSGLAQIIARAIDLPERIAIDIAVAVEIVHTFTLVHDDLEDGATTRRGCPAVHVVHGAPIAINVGDALHALAWSIITALDAPPRHTLQVAKLFGVTLDRVVAGQARDLVWTRDCPSGLRLDQYIEMVRGKSGALLGFAAAAPAVAHGHAGADRLYAFGEELGIALQLLDDVAGVQGDASILGKPVGADANGFASAPMLVGVARSVELAARHVRRACEELYAANLPSPVEARLFAETMHDCLLDRAGVKGS
jgi:geranylgeranyl pyrophosphate synthase